MKPDLSAVGTNFYTATQKFDTSGEMYDPTGYTVSQGTSFSTPLIAGAAALLKAARPGLSMAQYRSLLIDNAGAASGGINSLSLACSTWSASLRSTATTVPAVVSFQIGGGDPNVSRSLTISNIGTAPTVFQLTSSPPPPEPPCRNAQHG